MPWDPMRDLLTMQERLESLFGSTTPGWVPPADLCELADQYVLTVEVPGLRAEDVQMEAREGLLVLRGQRPAAGCGPERYQQLERGQGEFSRSFRFGQPVSPEAITSALVDGILTVVIRKTAPAIRRIPVE